jgi:hypothetical protein
MQPPNQEPEVLFANPETGELDLRLYRPEPHTIRLNACAGLVNLDTSWTVLSAAETIAKLKHVLNEDDTTWGLAKDKAIILPRQSSST